MCIMPESEGAFLSLSKLAGQIAGDRLIFRHSLTQAASLIALVNVRWLAMNRYCDTCTFFLARQNAGAICSMTGALLQYGQAACPDYDMSADHNEDMAEQPSINWALATKKHVKTEDFFGWRGKVACRKSVTTAELYGLPMK